MLWGISLTYTSVIRWTSKILYGVSIRSCHSFEVWICLVNFSIIFKGETIFVFFYLFSCTLSPFKKGLLKKERDCSPFLLFFWGRPLLTGEQILFDRVASLASESINHEQSIDIIILTHSEVHKYIYEWNKKFNSKKALGFSKRASYSIIFLWLITVSPRKYNGVLIAVKGEV